jgi:NitT/TauT family transport system ATP-binding protein
VTHDIDEAILLGDRVVVMGVNPGHIKEVLSIDLPRPRKPEVVDSEQFIGYRRILRNHLAADMASLRLLHRSA